MIGVVAREKLFFLYAASNFFISASLKLNKQVGRQILDVAQLISNVHYRNMNHFQNVHSNIFAVSKLANHLNILAGSKLSNHSNILAVSKLSNFFHALLSWE